MSTTLFDANVVPQAAIRHESLAYVARCLSFRECCALVGLSNTGKSTLLRTLQHPAVHEHCAQPGRLPPQVVLVDSLDGVVATEASFYELLLRRLIQSARGYGVGDARLAPVERLRAAQLAPIERLHAALLAGATPLACRFYFGQAVHGLLRSSPSVDLVIVLDNLDDLLCELAAPPLRHLRALRNAHGPRLAYVTATRRPPDELRDDEATYEFVELFQVYTHHLPPLTAGESAALLDYVAHSAGCALSPAQRKLAIALGGGHPGLLDRVARALAALPADLVADEARAIDALLGEAHVVAECQRLLQALSTADLARLQQRDPTGAGEQADLLARLRQNHSALREVSGYVLASPLLRAFVRAYRAHAPGRLRCDAATGQVWLDGREITLDLSEAQRRLLRHLYQHRGSVSGQQSIAEAIWGTDQGVSPGAIYELVKRLRIKIEVDWRHPRLLITIPGEGYRLELDD